MTEAVREKIVQALANGNYIDDAAYYAGVTPQTVHEWVARGRAASRRNEEEPKPCPTCRADGDDPCVSSSGKETGHFHAGRVHRPTKLEDEAIYVQFAEEVERARAGAQVRNLGLIQRAAMDGSWQAAAWFLERSNPQKWGRKQLEVTGRGGGPIEIANLPAEEQKERLRMLKEELERRLITD